MNPENIGQSCKKSALRMLQAFHLVGCRAAHWTDYENAEVLL